MINCCSAIRNRTSKENRTLCALNISIEESTIWHFKLVMPGKFFRAHLSKNPLNSIPREYSLAIHSSLIVAVLEFLREHVDTK